MCVIVLKASQEASWSVDRRPREDKSPAAWPPSCSPVLLVVVVVVALLVMVVVAMVVVVAVVVVACRCL